MTETNSQEGKLTKLKGDIDCHVPSEKFRDGFDNMVWDSDIAYKSGEPCNHKGCLNHITHPCEGCGRVGGEGIILKRNW